MNIVKCLGRATSKDVAFELLRMGFSCSGKAVSMRLLRYKRQGLVERARWGRSGFVYRITHQGEQRLQYLKQFQRKLENFAASSRIIQTAPHYFFDKQLYELALDNVLVQSVTSVPRAENRILPVLTSKGDSGVASFFLWRKELDRRVRCEKFCEEIMVGYQELIRIIVDLLVKHKPSMNYESSMSFRNVRTEVNTQHQFPFVRSFQKKKRRPYSVLQKRDAQADAQLLKKTQAHPKSFRFSIPAPSAKTLKLMREAAKDAYKPASFPQKSSSGRVRSR